MTTWLGTESAERAVYVRRLLQICAWSMLRIRNEHSQAFKGRYTPENAPWGVEIMECQYWPHVRTVDVAASPQLGKTFHVCEIPTLYDVAEARETVFYMNGSADNALNIWTTRWVKTLAADAVLSEQLLDRMDAGRWGERHFADGGLLYSAGPESVAALSQRESRIVRCSELEKTKAALGNEASSYALARDRAGAYPGNHLITSDCTVTVREGLSWVRFVQGDRSRPFIPCAACGHYAMPAHERHVAESDLALTPDTVHFLNIAPLASASPTAAEEQAALACGKCGAVFSNRDFRAAMRAVVWVPVGCTVKRSDDVKKMPIPKVSWLDELRAWAGNQLADPDVVEGLKDPAEPPKWEGPRLPDGVTLDWTPETTKEDDKDKLPVFRPDPRKASARSFWLWRVCSPKYTIGQVARELVAGELGAITGDVPDDQKTVTQKCLVLPWVEIVVGGIEDLNEDVVLMCVSDLPRGRAPERSVLRTAGIDINEDAVRFVIRGWCEDGDAYLIDHGPEWTGLVQYKRETKVDRSSAQFHATRWTAIEAALNRAWARISNGVHDSAGTQTVEMTYVDAGAEWAEQVYAWCGGKSFHRLRPSKGFGVGNPLQRRGGMAGQWTDSSEKKAVECRDARGKPLHHQFYDPKDPRMMMRLHADHWKRQVHDAIKLHSLYAKATQIKAEADFVRPWFWLHADVNRKDDYVKQVLGERWEETIDPKSGRHIARWKEYYRDNHFLDCEAMCFAAAGLLGVSIGHTARRVIKPARRSMPAAPQAGHDPSLG